MRFLTVFRIFGLLTGTILSVILSAASKATSHLIRCFINRSSVFPVFIGLRKAKECPL